MLQLPILYNASVMSSSCRYSTWYGFGSPSGEAGVISKIMHGYGNAILDFGNCGSSGEVKVYLDNELVATAGAYTRSKIVILTLQIHRYFGFSIHLIPMQSYHLIHSMVLFLHALIPATRPLTFYLGATWK